MEERSTSDVVGGNPYGSSVAGPDRSSGIGAGVSEVARQSKEKALGMKGDVRQYLVRELDSRRGTIAHGLREIAQRIGDSEDNPVAGIVASFATKASDQIERYSADDALRMVRSNPAAMLAGCFAVGFLGARLVKG